MSAYINKCSACADEHGIHNCELHKTMNKSTISLNNVSCYHSSKNKVEPTYNAIGSGRPSYKNYQTNTNINKNESTNDISESFLRNASFKRNPVIKTQERPGSLTN